MTTNSSSFLSRDVSPNHQRPKHVCSLPEFPRLNRYNIAPTSKYPNSHLGVVSHRTNQDVCYNSPLQCHRDQVSSLSPDEYGCSEQTLSSLNTLERYNYQEEEETLPSLLDNTMSSLKAHSLDVSPSLDSHYEVAPPTITRSLDDEYSHQRRSDTLVGPCQDSTHKHRVPAHNLDERCHQLTTSTSSRTHQEDVTHKAYGSTTSRAPAIQNRSYSENVLSPGLHQLHDMSKCLPAHVSKSDATIDVSSDLSGSSGPPSHVSPGIIHHTTPHPSLHPHTSPGIIHHTTPHPSLHPHTSPGIIHHTTPHPSLHPHTSPGIIHHTTPHPSLHPHTSPGIIHHTTPHPSLHPHTSPGIIHTPSTTSKPHPVSGRLFSCATLENERYSLETIPRSDHHNEDRYFSLEGPNFKVFGVFDGHDGSRAADFALDYFREVFYFDSWRKIIDTNADISEVLKEMFLDADREFFKSIQHVIIEKEHLQRRIPSHLTSYAAYQQYPNEVARLQDIGPMLSGGCTGVLATIVRDRLYVANVGDSRVILVRKLSSGLLEAEQLNVDHSVDNKDELDRLERLGLDPEVLAKSGRLGMHENTRSIGDYSIKQGYKDVDSLRSARSPPGLATPYIMPARQVDGSFEYLILMTDGVYKSIESTIQDQDAINANKVLLNMMDHSLKLSNFQLISDRLLERIARIHADCYIKHAKRDPRSPMAVSCRKRDDMTLLVYGFSDSRLN